MVCGEEYVIIEHYKFNEIIVILLIFNKLFFLPYIEFMLNKTKNQNYSCFRFFVIMHILTSLMRLFAKNIHSLTV